MEPAKKENYTGLIIIYGLLGSVMVALLLKYITKNGNNTNPLKGKNEVDDFWYKTIYGVIAHEGGKSEFGGKGKKFTDLFGLDSGTVGICHFAASGLCSLYKNMDTQKYFNRSSSEMCDNWANGNSGAYDQEWWRKGMEEFVNNPDNEMIQVNTCKKSRSSAIRRAKENGWTTDREFAIAAGVSNSYGNGGFGKNAKRLNWDAEKVLDWYGNESAHQGRRKGLINKWFPKSKAKKIDL